MERGVVGVVSGSEKAAENGIRNAAHEAGLKCDRLDDMLVIEFFNSPVDAFAPFNAVWNPVVLSARSAVSLAI